MISLEMSHQGWVLLAFVIFFGAKIMQRTGELYATGRPYHGLLALSAACIIGSFFVVGLMLVSQNLPDTPTQ